MRAVAMAFRPAAVLLVSAAVFLLLAACQGPMIDYDDGASSGTRLKVHGPAWPFGCSTCPPASE